MVLAVVSEGATSARTRRRPIVKGKANRKGTTFSGHIASGKAPSIHFDIFSGNSKAKAETASVTSALCKRQEYIFCISSWKSATVINDINQDAVRRCMHVQKDCGVFLREFESVLHQTSKSCIQQVSITLSIERWTNDGHKKRTSSNLSS